MGRLLSVVASVLGAAFVLLVLAAALLAATSPRPVDRPGWQRQADMPFPRGEVGSTTVNEEEGGGVLVVAGGFAAPATASDRVSVYDIGEDRWDEAPRLPAPRHHPGLAGLDDGVLLSGGAAGARDWTPLANVWLLEAGTDQWVALEPMPEGRHSHRMVALERRLYVIGGHGESADVLIWHPEEGWARGAPLPSPRHHLTVVDVDQEIWAIGGRDDDTVLTDVHVYEPDADTWRPGPRLPIPVSAAVEGVIRGTIHLVGGEDPAVPAGGTIDRHLVLRPGSDRWEDASPAPVAVHGAAGGVIGDRLVVAGGSRRQGLLSPLGWTGLTAVFEPEQQR